MNKAKLRAALANEIQDESYSSAQLDDFIHQAALRTAGEVKLPDLKRLGSVSTIAGQAYAPLTNVSGGFSGRLSRVLNYDLEVYPSLDLLADAYASKTGNESMDSAGELEAVALEGRNLWYQYIPETSASLALIYYQNPPVLSSDNDEPDWLPEEVHYRCLVNGAAFLIYNQKEDGEDDGKVNTRIHFDASFNWNSKHSGINATRAWVSRNRVPHVSSCWDA
jgi:hypothetical protein